MVDLPEMPETADPYERARNYRERALDLLAIARGLLVPNQRTLLLQTAQDYRHMADAVEKGAGADALTLVVARLRLLAKG